MCRFVTLVLSLAVAMAGCTLSRKGVIRQEAARLVAKCAVEAPGSVTWVELEPYLYKVKACGVDLWCRERNSIKCQTTEILTTEQDTLARAAELLGCPASAINILRIDFAMGDPVKDRWWWGVDEAVGCGRAVWCGERERPGTRTLERLCEQPVDFETAAAQLAVETACPVDQLQPLARQVFAPREWIQVRGQPGQATMQITWRIGGCGRTYVCTLNGGTAPTVSCKVALDTAPVAPQP